MSARAASSPSTLTYTRACRRSGLVSTEVKVTNPMRGSLSPSAIRAERTSRTASLTLRMRSKATLMQVLGRYELAFHTGPVGKHPPHVAFDLGGPILEQAGVAADERSGQARALPEVMMVGLGDGRAEAPLKLRLDRRQLAALALEAAGLGEVQLDLEDADERRLGERLLDLLLLVDLDHVPLLHVGVVLEHDAALHPRGHLADVVLEAPQRSDPAVVDDRAVAHEAALRAAAHEAVGDVASRRSSRRARP